MSFAEIISAIDDFVWGPVMLILSGWNRQYFLQLD